MKSLETENYKSISNVQFQTALIINKDVGNPEASG